MPRILASLAVLSALLLPAVASAQTNCAERDKVVAKLSDSYGEAFAGGGLQNTQRVFEVWFSPEKGTWTILMTHANGTTCIMASGTNWREGLPTDVVPKGVPS